MNEGVPRIGISSCLLGNSVRHDGGHKHVPYVTESLMREFELVAVCPEVEAGFGVPRPAMHLAGDAASPRLTVTRSGEDVTERMRSWCDGHVAALAQLDLDGYIFKSRSPSCGVENVIVLDGAGVSTRGGRGIFAAALMARLPEIPCVEECALHDATLRQNFIEAVIAHHHRKSSTA